MLHINNICQAEIFSDEWNRIRLGRFTSSRINCFMNDSFLTQGAFSYLYNKIGEVLTNSVISEYDTNSDENTDWGKKYENEAIELFAKEKGISYLAVQKIILNPGTQFSSTPDAIWVKSVCKNDEEFNVSTVEVKCPRKYAYFIPYYLCTTPEKVKDANRSYYWQVLDQMDNCESAFGYLAFYHPFFPEGKRMRVIEFEKMKLWDDFKLLKERKYLAVQKFNELMDNFR